MVKEDCPGPQQCQRSTVAGIFPRPLSAQSFTIPKVDGSSSVHPSCSMNAGLCFLIDMAYCSLTCGY